MCLFCIFHLLSPSMASIFFDLALSGRPCSSVEMGMWTESVFTRWCFLCFCGSFNNLLTASINLSSSPLRLWAKTSRRRIRCSSSSAQSSIPKTSPTSSSRTSRSACSTCKSRTLSCPTRFIVRQRRRCCLVPTPFKLVMATSWRQPTFPGSWPTIDCCHSASLTNTKCRRTSGRRRSPPGGKSIAACCAKMPWWSISRLLRIWKCEFECSFSLVQA